MPSTISDNRSVTRVRKVGLLLLTFLLLVYVCSIGIRNVFRYNTFRLDYLEAVSVLKYEQQRNQQFYHQLEQMEHTNYWELRAKQLGYRSKNEIVYKLNPEATSKKRI